MALFVVLCVLNTWCVSHCAEIWSDTFELANAAFGTGLEWTVGGTGSITYPPSVTESKCPNGAYCWEFEENYYAYYIHSTSNYDNIALTVSVSGLSLETGDTCNVYYSIGSTTNWVSTSLATWTGDDTFPITEQISLPLDASDNGGVGIKLQSESASVGNKQDFCYFSNIILEGDIISTPSPTTKKPTNQPTKYPTWNPSTHPISTEPTTSPTAPTSAPITSSPTAPTSPTTPVPTKTPSITLNIGDNNGDDDDDDDDDEDESNTTGNGSGNVGLYVGIGGAVVCLIIVACVVLFMCKKGATAKKDPMHYVGTPVQENATAQYLDAYTGGNTGNNANEEVQNAQPNEDVQNVQPDIIVPVEFTETPRTEQAESALTGPAPPMELRQIFGPTQKDRIEKDKDSDSDDSLLKKQEYFNKMETK